MIYSDYKGEALTSAEIDNNFREIIKRLTQLEKCDFPQLGITSICIEGDRLIFKGPGDVTIGEATLPVITPRFRGEWQENTNYFFQDWVQRLGKLYVCHKTHPAQTFDPGYWQALGSDSTPQGGHL